MAGDGGRVPDVSEQRAEVEAVAQAIRDFAPMCDSVAAAEHVVAALTRLRDARGECALVTATRALYNYCLHLGINHAVMRDVDEALSCASPSRDGTVAVEDVERLRDLLAGLSEAARWFSTEADYTVAEVIEAEFAEALELAEAALAEFGSARAGESNEGDNQNDERRH